MSVFRVNLSQGRQGALDSNSVQRTVYITGPGKTNRKLSDGDTFTDSNYYKRYAFPAVSLDDAILEVVTDDGSVYSDDPSENTFPVVWKPGTSGSLGAGDTYDDTNMYLDVVGTYGGHAVFCQISNGDGSDSCKVRLNGSTNAVLTLAAGETQIFDNNDLSISYIEFDNSASGASTVNPVEVLLSIKSVSNS